MTKNISTLVDDMYDVVSGKGGWDAVVNEHFKDSLGKVMTTRLDPTSSYPTGTIRMSSIGQPCTRKFWYSINKPEASEELRASTKIKFLYGDILEELLLSLAEAAGHKVEGKQDTMSIKGIKGHRDAVIDGVTVDVKSASSYSFKKFKDHYLEDEDPFGYMWQLSSYVYAAKDDPLVTDKKGGAFLAIDKQHGTLCLDYYDFEDTGHLGKIDKLYEDRIDLSSHKSEPPRTFKDIPEGKSGNMKLDVQCSYCGYKDECWPTLRTFLYARGPVYLTKCVKTPNVPEVTNAS